jgi:flagella basal body P-ring formation protein FlgA
MRRCYSLFYLVIVVWFAISGTAWATVQEWTPDTLLTAYIKEHYPWAEIEMNNLALSGKVPDEAPFRILLEKGPPGRTVFLMEFKNGQKVKATAEVKALDWVVMSARAFKKGYRIQEGDIYMKLTDVTRIPGAALKSADLAIGKLLTRSLIANTPLLSSMVSDMPMVKKGQRVTLIIDAPHFRMTAPGEMREGNYVGSYVKAVNLASKKPVTGLLVDESTVKVEF